MNPTNKELEQRGVSPDEEALKEVEGYLERVEKQAEKAAPLTPAPATTPPPASVYDDMGKVIMQAARKKMGRGEIVLPLTEEGIRRGLHHKVIDAIRWLAEWSIYMIRKYPGRVFYKAK